MILSDPIWLGYNIDMLSMYFECRFGIALSFSWYWGAIKWGQETAAGVSSMYFCAILVYLSFASHKLVILGLEKHYEYKIHASKRTRCSVLNIYHNVEGKKRCT